MRSCFYSLLFVALMVLPAQTVRAEKTVAGRNLAGWSADLNHENFIARLRAVKSLGPFGSAAVEPLTAALDDKHPGVQYWAASHLGAIGLEAKPATKKLRILSKNSDQPAVALAATYALCEITGPEKHLAKLSEYLKYPERGMACSAAEFLGKLGPKAVAAVPALEAAYRNNDRVPGKKSKGNRDYHIRGACQNALRNIVPGWKLASK